MSKLDEIKQALEAATPGPLFTKYYDDFEDRIEITCEARGRKVGVAEIALGFRDSFDAEQKANARLIVEAVNNLPKLLKVAEAAGTLVDLYHEHEDDPDAVDQMEVQQAGDALVQALEAFK